MLRDKALFRVRCKRFLFSRLKGENRVKINNREETAEVAGAQRDATPSSRRGAPRPGAFLSTEAPEPEAAHRTGEWKGKSEREIERE